jgi:enterochelin esterase family protein
LTRGVFVYIPPEYNAVADSKYPVLYLLHGSGDDESAWLKVGKIDHIADNLHSQEKLGPTIIVMPYGHAIPDGQRTHGKYNNGVLAFEDDLINDLIPFVEKRYRVKAESRYRAIAGLSMGGGQSLFVGLRNSDKFQWVAGFSSSVSASSADRFLADLKDRPSEVNEQLSLLWIGCGKDDFLLQRNEEFIQWLKDADIAHSYQVTEGGHQWRVWRKYAAEILVQLWK